MPSKVSNSIAATDIEFDLRWDLAKVLEKRRIRQNLTIAQLSRKTRVPIQQVRRVFTPNLKGDVELLTVVKIANMLSLELIIQCAPENSC